MKSTLDQIEDIKTNGYSLDFSNVFNHAFENYKKIALYAGLMLLVFSILFGIAAFAIIVAIYGAESMSKDFIQNLQSEKLTYVQSIISTLCYALFGALVGPISAGFLKMADSADKDEEFNASTIFYFYKSPYFAQLFAASFIIAIIGNAINAVLQSFDIIYFGLVVSLLISYFTCFVIPLIAFGKLKAIDAIKSSFIMVSKQPLTILFLLIVAGILSLIGGFACCVGIIFTVPFSYSMSYVMYYEIIGVEEKEDSIDSIGHSDL
ncbi:hypothetical protein [Flavobacterium geliluteum]|uniref:Beta-carotene 15,15'-monooxygenase n=1 Tax=Flavobacterium geliluteum TaxID=2816120 RepID=A0A940X7T2_9FLAO|nr:hypothetical protein [Flavobacterium geliluteum]MBP4139953.1 hypothetical protein [Flavobacterium geliluteum]